jgi:hypothetical protein
MGYFIENAETGSARNNCLDARGLACGTSSLQALQHVETALESMLSYFGDPIAALDRAAAADPGWLHPLTLKACALLTTSEYAPTMLAREILATAGALTTASPREREHLAAAQAAARGDWAAACALWEAILVRWPRDVAALQFAHLFDFCRGDALNLQRRPQRVLPQWSADQPLYGYVLGMAAFGLEECGHHAQAEDTGRAALALNRRDPWAVHAVTHVFEMQGRHQEGARWLSTRHEDWAVENGFAFHNWFHAALFHLEAMDTDSALAVYDQQLAAATDTALQRVDGTAVLWRLKLLGVDVAGRFAQLCRSWDSEAPASGFYAFNDLHALVATIGAGETPALQARQDAIVASMAAPRSGGSANQQMSATIGLPLARAFVAYARQDWNGAAQGLLRVRDQAHGFGGSHAQRDILTLTLMDAAARSGNRALARHILNERRPAKSSTPLTAFWESRAGAR